MNLKKKLLLGAGVFVAVLVTSCSAVLSYESPCPEAPPVASDTPRMRAIMHRCYGSGAESLRLEEIAKPTARAGQVLVKVHAAALNPYDWHMTTGKPYVMRLSMGLGAPEYLRAGGDFAGTVEAVGDGVARFKVGDEVFGNSGGSFAEYVLAHENGAITHKPAELDFEEAAALPIAAITALQALRDQAKLQAGQKILVNGASGGVGTFAVQIAKAYGAKVTGVCSTRNVEMVRSLGADQVIDYTREDFTTRGERFDVILDNVGNHSFSALRAALEPGGIVVLVGGPKGPWIDPFIPMIKGSLVAHFVDEQFLWFIASMNVSDLDVLARLAREGRLRPVIGGRYTLEEVPAALDHLGGRHARGKLVVRVQ